MYYTGINPLDMKPVYVARDYHEKQLQRALLQYNRPQNDPLVREALVKAGREDLIGYGEDCLVKPEASRVSSANSHKEKSGSARKTTDQSQKHQSSGTKGKDATRNTDSSRKGRNFGKSANQAMIKSNSRSGSGSNGSKTPAYMKKKTSKR
jgi:activator of HSP90 ATPase